MTDAAPTYLQKLDALVETIMADASKEGVKLSERLDALKICSQHYVNTERLKGKKDPGDGGGTTMGGLRDRISQSAAPATQTGEREDEQT